MNSEVDNRLRFILLAAFLLAAMIGLRFLGSGSQPERNWVTSEPSSEASTASPEKRSLLGVNLVHAEPANPLDQRWIEPEPAPEVSVPEVSAPEVSVSVAPAPVVSAKEAFFAEATAVEKETSPEPQTLAASRADTPPAFPSTGAALYPQTHPAFEDAEAPTEQPLPLAQWQAPPDQPSLVELAASAIPSDIPPAPTSDASPSHASPSSETPALPTIKLTDHEMSILERIDPSDATELLEDREPFLPVTLVPETQPAFVIPNTPTPARVAALPLPLQSEQEKPKFKKFGATKKDQEKEDSEDERDDDDPPSKKSTSLSSSTDWKLAPTPRKGERYKDDTPLTDQHSALVKGAHGNFSPTPTSPGIGYDPLAQINVYQGKQLNANQRPLLELGRPWYQLGPISEGSSILGFHNNVNPQYVLFGDARSAIASNNSGGNGDTLIASQINLFHHLKLTSTERFVAGHSPLATGSNNTRFSFDDEELFFEGNANFNFAYFEGDVGALVGGATGKTLPFDLPFAAGIVPLVFQNGIWLEDEILGFALTIPARNSARFDISNMDITFFAGYDRLNSPAFEGDDSAARVFGVATFLDALNGHFEIDYAFLDDRTAADRSYHNIGFGYTRRFGRFLSNSTRVIVNAGQQNSSPGTADGVLFLSENSLITGHPSTVVPYLNFFAGFDRPQSVARNANAGGILRNTGILFESDNLTGYPTLDATANDTFGFAIGLNLLADEFAQQLVVEAAYLGVMGDAPDRNANGDQYGLGVRYQLPLTNSVLVRADAMVGFLRNDEDIRGARLEIRKKF